MLYVSLFGLKVWIRGFRLGFNGSEVRSLVVCTLAASLVLGRNLGLFRAPTDDTGQDLSKRLLPQKGTLNPKPWSFRTSSSTTLPLQPRLAQLGTERTKTLSQG